jgi:hypothetical protein
MIVVTIVMVIAIRSSGDNTLLICLAATISFLVLLSIFSAGLFVVAYIFGAVNRVFFDSELRPKSPFADGQMPPQIVPPTANE